MAITAAPGWSVNSLGTGVYQTGTIDPTVSTSTPTASSGTVTRTSTAAPTPAPTYTAPAPTPTPNPTYTAPTPAPAQTTPSTSSSSGVNNYGLTPASGQSWLQLQNGESIANYNARIAAANPNLPAPGTTSSTGVTNPVPATSTNSNSPTPNAGVLTSTNSSTNQPSNTIGSTGAAAGNNTFLGLLNQEANTSTAGSPATSQATTGLLASANSNPLTSGAAYQTYQDAVSKLADFKTRVASQFSNLEASGEPLGLVTGREAALQSGYASQLDAFQQEVTQAQAALGYGIQEQGQQQAGFTSAGNLGNTAQATAQSGLSTALGASAPSGSFPFVFNPQTGQFTNASTGTSVSTGFTGDYSSDTSKMAQAIIQGKTGYNDGQSALSSYYGNTAEGNLTQAIIAAGGNPTVLKAQAENLTSNVNTAGTANSAAYNQVFNAATSEAAKYSQQQSAINSIGNQVLSMMQNDPTINPSSAQFANTKLNQLGTQLSSPQYAAFNTAIQSLQARIGAALQAGEIPTAATSNAAAIANGSLAYPALAATLKQVDAEMGTFVQTQQALADYAKKQLNTSASNSSGSSGSSGGSTSSSLGGTYSQNAQGQWVYNP